MEKITCRLNWQDFKAIEFYLRSKNLTARLQFWKRHVFVPALWLAVLQITFPYWGTQYTFRGNNRLTLSAVFLVSWIVSLALQRWLVYRKIKLSGFLDYDFNFELSAAGLWHRGTNGEGTTFWSAIKEILDYRDHIFFVFSDEDALHVIPKRSFLTFEEASAFRQEALRLWKEHR